MSKELTNSLQTTTPNIKNDKKTEFFVAEWLVQKNKKEFTSIPNS